MRTPSRFRLALNVLRGRPTAYRVMLQPGEGLMLNGVSHAMIIGCTFTGTGTAVTADLNDDDWPDAALWVPAPRE